METIPTKDIAIAVFGGSAAIASILLVFLGFMMAKADALSEDTPDVVIRKYTRTSKLCLIPFLAQVIVLFSAYLWLFSPSNSLLFYLWSAGFAIAIVLFVVYSAAVTLLL